MNIEAHELRTIKNAIDTAMSEVEAAVADGDVDESVLYGLDEAMTILDRVSARGDKVSVS